MGRYTDFSRYSDDDGPCDCGEHDGDTDDSPRWHDEDRRNADPGPEGDGEVEPVECWDCGGTTHPDEEYEGCFRCDDEDCGQLTNEDGDDANEFGTLSDEAERAAERRQMGITS